jgi:hypothetical protein
MPDRGRQSDSDESERGKRASFDRVSGEVHGSGSGTGANAGADEDYDDDVIAGGGEDQVGGPRPATEGVKGRTDPDEGI